MNSVRTTAFGQLKQLLPPASTFVSCRSHLVQRSLPTHVPLTRTLTRARAHARTLTLTTTDKTAPLVKPKNILSIQSHVVHGHAGNSAAVFPMQRVGVNVWPLHTVQFSNHTQYPEGFQGMRMTPEHIADIARGLGNIGKLQECDAVLSGYLGSVEQGQSILELVQQVKKSNDDALYCCDPVMGHPEKGCIVSDGVAEFFKHEALPVADIICPNVLELEMLSGVTISSFDDVVVAARALLARGPSFVLVKHLGRIGARSTRSGKAASFEMLLATSAGGSCSYPGEVFHIERPLLHFDREPVGVGDLTSGLFLAHLVKGERPKVALERTTAGVSAVMDTTSKLGSYELQLVAAQDEIESAKNNYVAEQLILRRT